MLKSHILILWYKFNILSKNINLYFYNVKSSNNYWNSKMNNNNNNENWFKRVINNVLILFKFIKRTISLLFKLIIYRSYNAKYIIYTKNLVYNIINNIIIFNNNILKASNSIIEYLLLIIFLGWFAYNMLVITLYILTLTLYYFFLPIQLFGDYLFEIAISHFQENYNYQFHTLYLMEPDSNNLANNSLTNYGMCQSPNGNLYIYSSNHYRWNEMKPYLIMLGNQDPSTLNHLEPDNQPINRWLDRIIYEGRILQPKNSSISPIFLISLLIKNKHCKK